MAIMILVPVFLYPALFVIAEQLALFGQRSLEESAVRVAVIGTAPAEPPLARDRSVHVEAGGPASFDALRTGTLDAIVEVRPPEQSELGSARVRIVYDGAQDRSLRARAVIGNRLDEWNDSLLAARLDSLGLPRSAGAPLVVSDSSVATPTQMGGYALGRFLPMILILMTILGAFYPAVDLAAGEKERGTLEPLLTTPVPADEIVAGKFAAVSAIALASAMLNLVSMMLTFQSGLFQFTEAAGLRFSLSPGVVLVIFGTLAMLAILFASLFLGVAVRSHSFKEAQNAVTPIYIASLLPAMLATVPGIDFTPTFALVPVGGVALLFRALAAGNAEMTPSIIAIGATIVYAMLALVFAVRAFGREEVLFGDGASAREPRSWQERIAAWRTLRRDVPRPFAAFVLVGAVAVLGFYFGRMLQLSYGEYGLLLMQLLLLGTPAVLFTTIGRYDVRRTLALRRPSPRALAAALLLIAGGIPVAWTLAWLQSLVMELPWQLLEGLQQLLQAPDPSRLLWLLLLVAVVPAVCEELVFRGVLLQSLGRELPMGKAVVVSAVVFGAFHLSTETAIRFLPTMWTGLLLGYVVWHTRPIFAGMLMHFVNNAMAVLLVSSPALQHVLTGETGRPHWAVLLAAPVLLAAGVRMLPKRHEHAVGVVAGEDAPRTAATDLARIPS
jgi:sodium transport system permease protein